MSLTWTANNPIPTPSPHTPTHTPSSHSLLALPPRTPSPHHQHHPLSTTVHPLDHHHLGPFSLSGVVVVLLILFLLPRQARPLPSGHPHCHGQKATQRPASRRGVVLLACGGLSLVGIPTGLEPGRRCVDDSHPPPIAPMTTNSLSEVRCRWVWVVTLRPIHHPHPHSTRLVCLLATPSQEAFSCPIHPRQGYDLDVTWPP
jgi:hypothetical protein